MHMYIYVHFQVHTYLMHSYYKYSYALLRENWKTEKIEIIQSCHLCA